MRKTLISIAVAALVTAPFAVVADSANWSEEKAAQVDQNRNTNSGNGNGGERQRNNGSWTSTTNGETGGRDNDPGNSGNQCQGGKNC
ncbi:MAG: hypothetical protein HOY44_16755 [Maritimibacter sp.]|uniref:hypothetical protein n=1 Tax=Maritimibacter sp. TaxID=2003363 RepID=UPI001E0E3537|nr:hypothetical protein [Maritimibacter sp.]MBL6429177.1 hypothetical protein [Maritimibacter sp.]